ncbi:MAG: hypothetical protein ACLPX8_14760 [Bryobacteraceae bacterium]
MADQRYIEIPGGKTHELPPLLLHGMEAIAGENCPADLDSAMPEAEEMLAHSDADRATIEQRTFELALQLAEQYKGLLNHWSWGDSVLEWIRQCEITFESQCALRSLLQPDVWPHAGRASFVTLLREKQIPTPGVTIERAVGLRLTFRQPPPLGCCSSQFLLYLNSSVADTAFQTWSHLARQTPGLLPPHRFHFEVVNVGN